jgi:futalosine hydrolase
MNILLVASTIQEISPFMEYYRKEKKSSPTNTLDVLITGIGLTACTYSLCKYFSLQRPDLIIQAGISGCFESSIPLASVVVVQKETIADQCVVEQNQFKTLFDLKLLRHNQYPYKKGWLVNKNEILKKTKLKKVRGISVNEITTSSKKVLYYKEAFRPVIESMEGAALHYVSLMEQVPFIQLRAISNYVAERNKKKWKTTESIQNLNQELIKIIERFQLLN